MTAGDALFQAPGPARIVLEHFQIVIRFEHEDIGGANTFANQARGVAKVREETDFMAAGVQHVTDGIVGVVRNGKRVDANIADVERRTGREQVTAFEFNLELQFDRFASQAIAVNRNF